MGQRRRLRMLAVLGIAALSGVAATMLVSPAAPAIASNGDSAITYVGDPPISINLGANDSGNVASIRFIDMSTAGVTVSADGMSAVVVGQGRFDLQGTTGVAIFTPDPAYIGRVSDVFYSIDRYGRVDNVPVSVTIADTRDRPVITAVRPEMLGNTGNTNTLNSVCIHIDGVNLQNATITVGGGSTVRVTDPQTQCGLAPGSGNSQRFNPAQIAPSTGAPETITVLPRVNFLNSLQGLTEAPIVATGPSGSFSDPFMVPLQGLPQLQVSGSNAIVTPEGGLVRLPGTNLNAATRGILYQFGQLWGTYPVVESGPDYIVVNMPPRPDGTRMGLAPATSAGEGSDVNISWQRETITLNGLSSTSGPAAGGQFITLTGVCVGLPSSRAFFGGQEVPIAQRFTLPGTSYPAISVQVPPGSGTVDVHVIASSGSCRQINGGVPNPPMNYVTSNARAFTYLAAPVATADTATTAEDRPITVNVLQNDTADAASPIDTTSVVFPSAAQPTGATIAPDGKTLTVAGVGTWVVDTAGTVTFTPEAGFVGTAPAVTYQVTDQSRVTAAATLTVEVAAASTAAPDTAGGTTGTSTTVDVLANDPASAATTWDPATVRFPATGQPAGAVTDPTGRALTVPGEGTYSIEPDGRITFAPLPSFIGVASPITYSVDDGVGVTASATLTMSIAAAPPAPPSATPEPTVTAPPPTYSAPAPTGGEGSDARLPQTGAEQPLGALIAALALLMMGLGAALRTRRRSTTH